MKRAMGFGSFLRRPLSGGLQEQLPLLRQLAKAIEHLFAPNCEVVIHDFSDLEHSIVHLEGDLSDRSIGGAATDLLLARVRAGETSEDLHGYRTELPNHRVMKSSTIFLRDENGRALGAFCINYDISAFIRFQRVLSDFTQVDVSEHATETLSDDIYHTIRGMVTETIKEIGVNAPVVSREDKINLIARLDEKGAFQVKKAVSIVADEFGFSRATIYNYLREARVERAERARMRNGSEKEV